MYLKKLIENSRDVFWIRSPDYKKQIYISPVYEDIWGRSCESLYREPTKWLDYLIDEDRIRLQKSLTQRNPDVSPKQEFHEWYRIKRSDGEVRSIKDQSFPLYEDNRLIGFGGIAQDITEEKLKEKQIVEAKEQAESANELKTDFIHNMEHDIRTPSSNLYALSQMLAKKEFDPKRKAILSEITESVKELMTHCDSIVEFSKIESGYMRVSSKPFKPREIFDAVVRLEKMAARGKGLDLLFEYDDAIPAVFMGDPYRFKRIFLNLASNAIKFTSSGCVKFSLSLVEHKQTESRAIVKLTIEDTGCGIPDDKQSMIFERFNKLVASNKEWYKGLGLGLTIVKRFVSELQGNLQLKSKLNKGSRFTVFLPAKLPLSDKILDEEPLNLEALSRGNESKEASVQPLESKDIEFSHKGGTVSVLLVEDNKIAQNIAKATLLDIGCSVDAADTGEQAAEKSVKKGYDFIFMDLGLPEMDGFDTVKVIRGTDNPNKNTPIVALTAHTDDETRAKCLSIGMNAALAKPLAPQTAWEMLKTFVPGAVNQQESSISSEDVLAVDQKVIDWELGIEISGSAEMANQMFSMLMSSMPESLFKIREAHNDGDAEAFISELHKLYGGLCYVGLPRLKEAANQLYKAVQSGGDLKKVSNLYQAFLREVTLFEEASDKLG